MNIKGSPVDGAVITPAEPTLAAWTPVFEEANDGDEDEDEGVAAVDGDPDQTLLEMAKDRENGQRGKQESEIEDDDDEDDVIDSRRKAKGAKRSPEMRSGTTTRRTETRSVGVTIFFPFVQQMSGLLFIVVSLWDRFSFI